jgi:hypothetical protein
MDALEIVSFLLTVLAPLLRTVADLMLYDADLPGTTPEQANQRRRAASWVAAIACLMGVANPLLTLAPKPR